MSDTANALALPSPEPDEPSAALNKKRIEAAHSWFIWWIDSRKLEFTSAARMLGLNDGGRSICSKFYHRKLDDPAKVVLAIEALRAQIEGPEGISAHVGFRMTRCAKAIFKYATAARDAHAIGLLISTQGVGKTTAVREFQRRTEGDGKPPVEYIYCRVSTDLPSLINDVAAQLDLIARGKSGDPARLHQRIADKLKSNPRFLIFDEADYLKPRALDFIRNLNDESGAGSLLIGRPPLLKTVKEGASWTTLDNDERERLVRDGPLAPFVDRIFFSMLPGLADDEVVEIAEDVLKAHFTEEAISKLLFHVGPSFRTLAKMIGKLRDIRLRAGSKIDQDMVDAAWVKIQMLDVDGPRK